MIKEMNRRGGFTLIELIVYMAIFAVSAVFLVSILTSVTRTQVRQASGNEVNQQLSFVASTIQRLVRSASVIENDAGVASTTLLLRMASSTADPTKIYVDASSTAIYLAEATSTPMRLTDDKVTVGNFSVTKQEPSGGLAVVQIDLTLEYQTTATRAKTSRTWRGAVARISAATFDSGIVPNASGNLDIGSASLLWRDAYFSGDVTVGASGQLGVGGNPSALSTTKIFATGGDIGFATSTYGIILKSPNSTCYRLGVSNAGAITTSSVTCP
ncbi:MAG: prepilin-type N-terminal cleavage/methylation domain-containing protein [Candidatus Brennerbacteria bacterium]|nr:prepilin-type N-terminal cleavage/methylation domain-containing protein [Candidatus Brennerbacteria bacterium]